MPEEDHVCGILCLPSQEDLSVYQNENHVIPLKTEASSKNLNTLEDYMIVLEDYDEQGTGSEFGRLYRSEAFRRLYLTGTEKKASVWLLTDEKDTGEDIELWIIYATSAGELYAEKSGVVLNTAENDTWEHSWSYESTDPYKKDINETYRHDVYFSVFTGQIDYQETLRIQGFDNQNHQILEKEYSYDDLKEAEEPVEINRHIKLINAEGNLLDHEGKYMRQLSLECPCDIMCLTKNGFGFMSVMAVTFMNAEY